MQNLSCMGIKSDTFPSQPYASKNVSKKGVKENFDSCIFIAVCKIAIGVVSPIVKRHGHAVLRVKFKMYTTTQCESTIAKAFIKFFQTFGPWTF